MRRCFEGIATKHDIWQMAWTWAACFRICFITAMSLSAAALSIAVLQNTPCGSSEMCRLWSELRQRRAQGEATQPLAEDICDYYQHAPLSDCTQRTQGIILPNRPTPSLWYPTPSLLHASKTGCPVIWRLASKPPVTTFTTVKTWDGQVMENDIKNMGKYTTAVVGNKNKKSVTGWSCAGGRWRDMTLRNMCCYVLLTCLRAA